MASSQPARTKLLAPVRPNAGVELAYRRRLQALIDEMHRSVIYWVKAAYRANPPELHAVHRELASDASPARSLSTTIRGLSRRWQKRFNDLSASMAKYFAQQVETRSRGQLAEILRQGGFSVELKMSRAVNDVLQGAIGENVSLIKSIPQKYLADVEQSVMRSVARGRDLASLTEELQDKFHATRKRAAFIAIDQNNKATSAIVHARQAEIGIKEAVWVHSRGGKTPRPSHLKAGHDKVRYDVTTGWFDPHEQRYVFPGELIRCRCVSRPVVPELS